LANVFQLAFVYASRGYFAPVRTGTLIPLLTYPPFYVLSTEKE